MTNASASATTFSTGFSYSRTLVNTFVFVSGSATGGGGIVNGTLTTDTTSSACRVEADGSADEGVDTRELRGRAGSEGWLLRAAGHALVDEHGDRESAQAADGVRDRLDALGVLVGRRGVARSRATLRTWNDLRLLLLLRDLLVWIHRLRSALDAIEVHRRGDLHARIAAPDDLSDEVFGARLEVAFDLALDAHLPAAQPRRRSGLVR
jgi:hypothetical protein